jgi:hypothetical protein
LAAIEMQFCADVPIGLLPVLVLHQIGRIVAPELVAAQFRR